MHTSSILGSLTAIAGSLALTGALQAATITVPNGDFEADYANRQNSSSSVGQVNGAPPSWTLSGTQGGTFSPLVTSSDGGATHPSSFWTSYDSGLHGNLIAFTQGVSTLSQTLTDTYQTGQTYTLTVLVGDSYESPSPVSDPTSNPDGLAYAIQLLAGSTVVAETNSTSFPAANTHLSVDVTFDVADNASVIGQPITIAIKGYTGGSATFDNVSLSAVPEPASLSLLGLGALGLLRRRRHA